MAQDGIAVLIVENEAQIRMDMAAFLDDEGLVVQEAENVEEAIVVLHLHSDMSVMFTDFDMPGNVDGLRVAAAVRDRWPPVQIIVTSGHRQLSDDELPIQCSFFSKPYNQSLVIHAIREMPSW